MTSSLSLQERYSPNSLCFGCGPKNPQGLHIKSFPRGDQLVAEWAPKPHHVAFSNFASGGILSVLLDCQGNWTAAYSLMKARGLRRPPGTVTAELKVKFLRPTPVSGVWRLKAWPSKVSKDRVSVEGEVTADGRPTAKMSGLFVAVERDHPAYHRWR